MIRHKIFFLFLVITVLPTSLFSQNTFERPVKTSTQIKRDSVFSHKLQLIISFQADSNWMVYDSLVGGEGPIPVNITFSKMENLILLKKLKPHLHKKFDDLFGIDIFYFKNEANYEFEFQLIDPNLPYVLNGSFESMACNLVSGVCLPPVVQNFTHSGNK